MNKRSRRILWGVLLLSFILLLVAIYFSMLTCPRVPDDLNDIALSNPSVIYGSEDEVVKMLADRVVISIDEMPPAVQQAFISLEDDSFYRHHGISKLHLMRALAENLVHLGGKGGGSSITQQLAKNLFFSFERDWARKFKEMFVAFQIEQQFTKEEILEAYINQINFGSGVYGIELASQTYFAKHASELTLAESAILAGIPRWPARYNPSTNPGVAKERQSFVLRRMVDEGFITEPERTVAWAESIKVDRVNRLQGSADYFVEEIKSRTADKLTPDAVNFGGLRIYATVDSRLQLEATRAVAEGLARLDESLGLDPYNKASWEERINYPQAALVAVDVRTGAVRAMVGGRDFRRAPFNRATANNRHAGSAFKPFIYFTALEKKLITPATVKVDEEVAFPNGSNTWSPDNIDFNYLGPVTMKYALLRSINTISAKLIYELSPEAVTAAAQRLGITSMLEPNLSLALGATGVSPIEMASAFATIANGGIRCQPFILRSIHNELNEVVEETIPKSQRVTDAQTAFLLLDMLTGVVEKGGTGSAVRSYGFYRPCAGKTGTSNDYRDAWFVGFTPELAVAVWVGYDDNRSMRDSRGKGITGSRAALPIWALFMKNACAGAQITNFQVPDRITFATIDPRTGSGRMPGGPSLTVALQAEE
ncbi:MAG TPA: PBP1A family penicillin-binding protein [bacterium]|nr:PBP1A family penicillin-binding protein [bacterium]